MSLPLIDRVEDDVIADGKKLVHILGSKCRGIDVRLFSERLSHLLVAETRLMVAARGRAGKVLAQLRIGGIAGKSLLRKKNMRAGSVRYILQDRGVLPESLHVHHESRGGDSF